MNLGGRGWVAALSIFIYGYFKPEHELSQFQRILKYFSILRITTLSCLCKDSFLCILLQNMQPVALFP